MSTVKKEVTNRLNRLQKNCSFEDEQYHSYVLQKIENGLKDVAEGNTFTQEEVEKILVKWVKSNMDREIS